jgi:hypothetical protein
MFHSGVRQTAAAGILEELCWAWLEDATGKPIVYIYHRRKDVALMRLLLAKS